MRKILVTIIVIILIGLYLAFAIESNEVGGIEGTDLNVKKLEMKSMNTVKPDIDFGKIPLYFVTNNGQVNQRAKFYAKASRYTLWLTKKGLIFDSNHRVEDEKQNAEADRLPVTYEGKFARDVSQLAFLNSNRNPEMIPIDETKLKVNYFRGNDKSKWYGAVPTSKAVLYKNLYKNIDLKVYGLEKKIEYDWIVKPGGVPLDITFEYKNVKGTRIDNNGNLLIETEFGELMHRKPVSYQQLGRQRRSIDVAFKRLEGNTYGFRVGAYDKNCELVIDPVVMAYSTYLGGSNYEHGYAIAVDSSGKVYVTGWTSSVDFPIYNQYQPHQSNTDVFFTKLDPAQGGSPSILYSTCIGGSDYNEAYGIAIDSDGNAYVTGMTASVNFPIVNHYQENQGGRDVFVAKLDPTQSGVSSLLYSTYLGGGNDDFGTGIAVDKDGNAYVTGWTESTDFPTLNQYHEHQGRRDAFITKLDTNRGGVSGLLYSTYLGGSETDQGRGIAVDANGVVYVVGDTNSEYFPILNHYQGDPGDFDQDVFITKIDTTLNGVSSLLYSTYLGGDEEDFGMGITIDADGNAYVVGYTESTNFPTLNQFQNDQGGRDVFVAKLDTNRGGVSGLLYSTYLGGSNYDNGRGIALETSGYVYVTGDTLSTDFPTYNQYQTDQTDRDGFVSMLDMNKSGAVSLIYSTYLGGEHIDYGHAIAVDGSGNAYVTGTTLSKDFPIVNPYQGDQLGFDAFISKLYFEPPKTITVTIPNGGEEFVLGSLRDITWNTNLVSGTLKITLWKDGQLVGNIADNISPAVNTYSWSVGQYSEGIAVPGIGYTVQIEENDSPVSDESDAAFTLITQPTVATAVVTDITAETVQGGGNVTFDGYAAVISRGVCWNTAPDPTIAHNSVNTGTGTGTFSSAITGLLPGVTYYVRAFAVNAAGIAYGEEVVFTTLDPIPSEEREFLVDLYNAVGGDNWNNNDGWKSGSLGDDGFGTPGSEGEWEGVVTGYVNGEKHLLQLDLKYNNLEGLIPQLFRELPHIRHIDLQGNKLSGNIPAWMGELTGLIELTLANNNLGGTIPPELSGLINLKILNLSGCGLSGSIPTQLAALTNLEQLSLANNNITGIIPPELAAMSKLVNLNLGNCNLDAGPIPSWLGNLTALQYLQLYGNNFNGPLPVELNNLVNLKILHLAYNQLTGNMPNVSAMSGLYKLDLGHNQFTGQLLSSLGNLTKLKYLYLNNNMLSGEVPSTLMNLAINRLFLQGNNGLFTDDPVLQTWLDVMNPGWDD